MDLKYYTYDKADHKVWSADHDATFCSPPGGADFETALKAQFDADPRLKEHHMGVYRILLQPDSPRKRRQLNRMERATRGALGYDNVAAIDWSSIDWTKILSVMLQVLGALLPFLVALL